MWCVSMNFSATAEPSAAWPSQTWPKAPWPRGCVSVYPGIGCNPASMATNHLLTACSRSPAPANQEGLGCQAGVSRVFLHWGGVAKTEFVRRDRQIAAQSFFLLPRNSLMAAVVLDAVTKSFGAHVAVRELSLQVPQGSIYGFIGPNGSGKTTTLRMIMRIFLP